MEPNLDRHLTLCLNPPTLDDAPQPDPVHFLFLESRVPTPEDISSDAGTLADSDTDMPVTTLSHYPPILSPSESASDSPHRDSWAVFAQLPALENAHEED